MPWSVGDVDSHKKGLTPSQKKKWVKIANGVLKKCGSGSACEGKAIRIANSSFMYDAVFFDGGFVLYNSLDVEECCEFAVKKGEPLRNFHSCRMKSPNYETYGYEKCAGKHGGKCVDHVYGIKGDKSELQAIRYPASSWDSSSAKKHCSGRGGVFTAAKGGEKKKKTSMEMVMKKETQKMPQGALHFMDHSCFAKAIPTDGDKIKLDMVVYSGGVIKNHFWWGNLAIDLDGMKFPKSKFPVLENHEQSRKVGFSSKPVIENYQLSLNPEKTEFVDTETANEFIKLSKAGFPYESSMYAQPSAIERLEQGTSAEVNGMTVKGPATIWRQSVFKEASVCVFGWDSNTRSAAFANQEIELPLEVNQLKFIEREVIFKMDLAQFKAEHKDAYEDLVAEVRDSVTAEIQAKFDKDKKDLEDRYKREAAEKDSQLAEGNKRLLELEKKDAIRSENEMKARADKVWLTKLGESNIPEHLHEKVMRHVSYSQFVKEGVLDREKFVEAIDAEIKDWETRGVTSTVLGTGFSQKEVDGGGQEQEADEKLVEDTTNNLLNLAGQEKTKDQT